MDIYAKRLLGIPFAPVLDVYLMFIFFLTLGGKILKSDLKRLIFVFLAALSLIVKFSHGFTLNSISLILTSRMPMMIFITIFLAMYYMRLQPDLKEIAKFTESIIAVLVIFIVLDGVYINYIGSINHLIVLLDQVGYRQLTNPVFFEFIANGLVPGPQHASIISCAGIILFFPHSRIKLSRLVLFGLSVVGLAFSVTNTALLSLILATMTTYFLVFRINVRAFFYGIILLAIILLIINSYSDWLVFRYDESVLGDADKQVVLLFVERYVEILLTPLESIISLPLYAKLTGVGHSSFEPVKNLLVDEYSIGYFAADFGYLIMILEYGLINMLIIMFIFLSYILYIKKNIKYLSNKEERRFIIRNTAIVSLFIFSASHYSTPTQHGLMQIIILIGAITLTMTQNRIFEKSQSSNYNSKLIK